MSALTTIITARIGHSSPPARDSRRDPEMCIWGDPADEVRARDVFGVRKEATVPTVREA